MLLDGNAPDRPDCDPDPRDRLASCDHLLSHGELIKVGSAPITNAEQKRPSGRQREKDESPIETDSCPKRPIPRDTRDVPARNEQLDARRVGANRRAGIG